MPDRVVLGKAEANANPYYHRTNKIGLFVSKPGSNVHNCSAGDLIFDSTLPGGMFQTIGEGYLKIPKAEYRRGLFGEEGVINESNWNSNEDIPELNSDTSWLFDAISYVYDDMKAAIAGLYEDPTVYRLKASGFPTTYTTEEVLDLNASVVSNPGAIASNLRYLAEYYRTYFSNLSTRVRYGEYLADELVNLGDINSEGFVKQMLKDLWRIYDVFPFINFFDSTHLNANFHFIIDSINVEYEPSQTLSTLNGTNLYNISAEGLDKLYSPTFSDIFSKIPLKSEVVESIIGTDNWISSTSTNFPWSEPFKNVWSSNFGGENNQNYFQYINKTAYSFFTHALTSESLATPTPWRAWTVSDGTPFSVKQECAAIAKYIKYVLICEWLVKEYGTFINSYTTSSTSDAINRVRSGFSVLDVPFPRSKFGGDGILDKGIPFTLTTSDTNTGTLKNSLVTFPSSITNVNDGIYLFCFKTSCPNTKTWNDIKTEQNIPTDPYSYSFWTGGENTYDTGIQPVSGSPTHIWWNAVSRNVTNAATNLPILNIRSNIVKESERSRRGFSLRPGLASIQANTYIENGTMYVKFSQPSVLDETEAFFKIYKESGTGSIAFKLAPVGKIGSAEASNAYGDTAPILSQQKGIADFVFDIRHTSDGGNSLVNRKSTDGRYYTPVFPDDFVGEKFTSDDPFSQYRNASGKIDYPLNITLSIPSGVVVSGNSFHNHINWNELPKTSSTKSSPYGPKDTAGKYSETLYASNDPCIKLNMNSGEFSNNALKGFFISIENRGTLVGAGGWGQYGQMYFDSVKYQTAYPGGGGGGGAGYHPQLVSENLKVDWLGADGITAEDRLDANGESIFVGQVDTTEEITLAQTAVTTHWNGPNNYVEWGLGQPYVEGFNYPAYTYYTGLDEITWNSIGPGKPGTGYLGATTDYHTSLDALIDRPYGPSFIRWSNNVSGIVRNTNIYERLPGTFSVQTGNPRYFIDGWGNPGTYGSTTIGGKGGGEKSVLTFGYPQNLTNTFSGSGGSCIYLYSNAAPNKVGIGLKVTNYDGGIIKAGGGGGSGGIGVPGLPGGKLGRPGGYIGASQYPNVPAESGREDVWTQYSRRGEPGRIVWWNAPNFSNNYYIVNYSTSTSGSVEGMEYNPTIGSDDYVSYLPNVSITQSGTNFNLYGQRLFSRILVGTQVQYHEMQERTYEDYINQTNGKGFV